MNTNGFGELAVSILRWIADDPQPGLVEFSLLDCNGKAWHFIDKQAIVSADALDAQSRFPRPGNTRCAILSLETDGSGRVVVRIDTEMPWGIEAADGTHVFRVAADRLTRSALESEPISASETIAITANKR